MPEVTTATPKAEIQAEISLPECRYPFFEGPVLIESSETKVELVKIFALPSSSLSRVVLIGIDSDGEVYVDAGWTNGTISVSATSLPKVFYSKRLLNFSGGQTSRVIENHDDHNTTSPQLQVWLPYDCCTSDREFSWMKESLPGVVKVTPPIVSRKPTIRRSDRS